MEGEGVVRCEVRGKQATTQAEAGYLTKKAIPFTETKIKTNHQMSVR